MGEPSNFVALSWQRQWGLTLHLVGVKKLIIRKEYDQAERYQRHVIDQAVEILKHRDIKCLFTTPRLLESLAERVSVPGVGVRGCFCGGTTMTPQAVRFWVEEVLEGKTLLVPTYGNTLMGLAVSPLRKLRFGDSDQTPLYSTFSWAGMLFSTGNHVVIRFRLLQNQPLRANVVPGMPPVATRIQITEVQAVL